MSKINVNTYAQMTIDASPKTNSMKTIPAAFAVGGIICVIGQLLMELYRHFGATVEVTPTLTSISLVAISALLTGFNVYDNIAKYAGAGTLVPITGFANAVVSPAIEFKTEGFILGVGAKIFVIAGPVIVYGTIASVLYGVIVFIFKL